jgi:hypothetical protein
MLNRKELGMRKSENGMWKNGKISDQGIWNFKREAFRGITRGSG